MIYCVTYPSSCNVKKLKDTEEEDLKRQSMLLHTDLSAILTTLTEWSVAPNVEFYEKKSLHRLTQYLQTFQFAK
jgi:hypothetical protein